LNIQQPRRRKPHIFDGNQKPLAVKICSDHISCRCVTESVWGLLDICVKIYKPCTRVGYSLLDLRCIEFLILHEARPRSQRRSIIQKSNTIKSHKRCTQTVMSCFGQSLSLEVSIPLHALFFQNVMPLVIGFTTQFATRMKFDLLIPPQHFFRIDMTYGGQVWSQVTGTESRNPVLV
jgi:hypothetical protein